MTSSLPVRRDRRGALLIVFAMALSLPLAVDAVNTADGQGAVKAALIYNFAKFTIRPTLLADVALVFCIVGDDEVANALIETVRRQTLDATDSMFGDLRTIGTGGMPSVIRGRSRESRIRRRRQGERPSGTQC